MSQTKALKPYPSNADQRIGNFLKREDVKNILLRLEEELQDSSRTIADSPPGTKSLEVKGLSQVKWTTLKLILCLTWWFPPSTGSLLNQTVFEIMLKRQRQSNREGFPFGSVLPFPNDRVYSTFMLERFKSENDWYGNYQPTIIRVLSHVKIVARRHSKATPSLRRGSGVAGKGQGIRKQLLRKSKGERLAPTTRQRNQVLLADSVGRKIQAELRFSTSKWTRRASGNTV